MHPTVRLETTNADDDAAAVKAIDAKLILIRPDEFANSIVLCLRIGNLEVGVYAKYIRVGDTPSDAEYNFRRQPDRCVRSWCALCCAKFTKCNVTEMQFIVCGT